MAQDLTVAEIIRLRWREEFEREADTTDEHVRYYEELKKLGDEEVQ